MCAKWVGNASLKISLKAQSESPVPCKLHLLELGESLQCLTLNVICLKASAQPGIGFIFLRDSFVYDDVTLNDLAISLCFLFFNAAPPSVRIIHSGHACNIEEERYTERVYTIREGETLELTCLVSGHPRPQVRFLVFTNL